jgi:HEAT repeat protein
MTCPLLFGCGPDDGPQGKYFGGQPVDHWLADVRSPNPKTRKKAAEVLGNVGPGDARSIPALIEAVKDADPGVRDAAVLGLSKIGPPAASAESILAEAATDKDPAVRAHAATALKRVRGTE